MSVSGPVSGTLTKEDKYGNAMYYFEGACSAAQMDFTIEYDVTRHEYNIDQELYRQQEAATDPDGNMDIYLKPSTLCFVTPQVKQEASKLTAEKTTTIEKAEAFYNHILASMSYDKNHQGWGRGDINHACDVGKGNCTDFHTYFTALCLSSRIPSRFQIGMWGKYDVVNGEYKTGGYHCWAEFHVAGQGWVPVDISEADKDPANIADYFGSHTGNRVTLSTGRDIILSPAQSGTPLNYFVNPYAEVANKAFSNVSKNCFWTDTQGE
ncbi:MAG: transglutaminase-like domain-containing protein [Planctomycetota bacterium]